LALICLGISGGTTLIHTDDADSLLRFHAGTSRVSHADSMGGPDVCLACEWENSVFNPQVPAIPLLPPVFTPLPLLSANAQTRFPYPFEHTSPRAPPRVS
jgi:hypothetical protein